jgi:hypothetical protein
MRFASYYSTTYSFSADAVWSAIRRFNDYQWGEGVGESRIENGKPENEPGAVRAFLYYGQPSRQRLLSHSDATRSMQWESAEAFDATLPYYSATLHVAPIVSTGGAFVEWLADFEAPESAHARWDELFVQEFGKSLERLRQILSSTSQHAGR